MARKMSDDERRAEEDLVMRDDDRGVRREDRNRHRTADDRDRGVAQRMQREQMRGRDGFADTDFRQRGAPGDWDNTGRSSDEQAFYSGSLRDDDAEVDGPESPIDMDNLGDGREQFFRDEDDGGNLNPDPSRARSR